MRRQWRAAACLGVILFAGPLSACGGDSNTDDKICHDASDTGGFAIAVGGRANSPTPALPESTEKSIDQVIADQKTVTVVRVDGHPSVACSVRFVSDAKASAAKAEERDEFKGLVTARIADERATQPEANPLAALSYAALAAKETGTVMLVDSGLQTVAPLDFRKNDLIDADPAEIAQRLKDANQLPELTGRKVILAGIGFTAAPQQPLDEAARKQLVAIWQGIAVAAGATDIQTIEAPNTSAAVAGSPAVSSVPIRPVATVAPGCGSSVVLADDDSVGFKPESTTFRDESAARTKLRVFTDFLAQHPTAQLELIGTVAHYGADVGDSGLPRERAKQVAQVIGDSGRISARGDGWGPFPTKDAQPSPVSDQLNRRVVVKISCP